MMNSNPTETAVTETPQSPARQGGSLWWLTVAVGVIVSMPFAWLLSYAAALPFYLGLFFFVLFGLVIGATMHRVASRRRPYGRAAILVGTTIVAGAGWIASIAVEGLGFPNDMGDDAIKRTLSIGNRSPEEYRKAVADEVRRFLRERYPPGGVVGYARWILTNGELKKGEIEGVKVTLRRGQRGYWWAVRVVLSIALLGFGIGSQTLPLRLRADPAVRVMDEQGKR
jgi:hypothetical protein